MTATAKSKTPVALITFTEAFRRSGVPDVVQFDQLIVAGLFPAPTIVADSIAAFLEHEIVEWITRNVEARADWVTSPVRQRVLEAAHQQSKVAAPKRRRQPATA